jgi:UDPglucose 6-dehydrogenase
LGAAFKPGTDDVRESPALKVVPALVDAGAEVVVHDPIALANFEQSVADERVRYDTDLEAAVADADAVVLITSWPEYATLPKLLAGRDVLLVDGRRMLDPDQLSRYDGVGFPG